MDGLLTNRSTYGQRFAVKISKSPGRSSRMARVQTTNNTPLRSSKMKARIEGSQTYNTEARQRSVNLASGFSKSSFAHNAAAISPMRGKGGTLVSSLRKEPRFFKKDDTPSEKLKKQSIKLLIQDYKLKKAESSTAKDVTPASVLGSLSTIKEGKTPLTRMRLKIGKSKSDHIHSHFTLQINRNSPKAEAAPLAIKTSLPVTFSDYAMPAKADEVQEVDVQKAQLTQQNPLFVAISKNLRAKQPGYKVAKFMKTIAKPNKETEENRKQLKMSLERKLNIEDVSEAVVQHNFSAVLIVLNYCKNCIQRAFAAFENNNKELMFKGMQDCYEYLVFCKKPQKVVLEMHQWILETLFMFKEYRRCIEYSDRFLMAAHEFKACHHSLRIYELMGHCYRETSNHKASLVSFYRMLFVALYLKSGSKELSAYASISREYYELGDVTTASYFYQKFSTNSVENEDSRLRHEYPVMSEFYCKEVIELRERKHKIGAESPRLSYYEGFPLADSEKLYAMKEIKRRTSSSTFEQIRQNAENLKGFVFNATDLGNPHLQRRYNKRAAMETVKLGDIFFHADFEIKQENISLMSEEEKMHILTMSKINFTNNTDQVYISHNSANRSPHYFQRITMDEMKSKKGIQPPICSRQVTSLKNDLAIIDALDLFNKIGLVVEKALETAGIYKREFG